MIARSFSLVNEYGQEYSLDDAKKSCLLTEPKGLGYGFSVNYIDIGDAFIRTKMKAKQGIISGTLIFGEEAHTNCMKNSANLYGTPDPCSLLTEYRGKYHSTCGKWT